MFHLQPCVHLQEEELAVLVDELDCAGVVIADRLGGLHRRFSHGLFHPVGQAGGRGFFNQFLVAALSRAVTGRHPHDIAVGIADDLHLDVTGPRQVPLHVHLVAAEEGLGLALGTRHGVVHIGSAFHDLHAAATTAVGGLDAHRPAELVTECADLIGSLRELGGSRHDRGATTLRGDTR